MALRCLCGADKGTRDNRPRTTWGLHPPTPFRSTKVPPSGTVGKRERFCADDDDEHHRFTAFHEHVRHSFISFRNYLQRGETLCGADLHFAELCRSDKDSGFGGEAPLREVVLYGCVATPIYHHFSGIVNMKTHKNEVWR